MRNLLDKAIVALINEDHKKFEELMHQFVVTKARQIHENLRQGDDVILGEDWDDEIDSENYMDGDDVGADDEAADDIEGDFDPEAEGNFGADSEADDDADPDADFDGGDLEDIDAAEKDADLNMDGDVDDGDLAVKLDSIEDKLEALAAQFDALMDEEGHEDNFEFTDPAGDPDEEEAADDAAGEEDEAAADEDFADGEAEEDAADDEFALADNEGNPDEDDEFDDITESVISELEKINAHNEESKEVGTGSKIKSNKDSSLPMKKVGARDGAEPVEIDSEDHNGFERETPKVKPGKLGNSKNAGAKAATLKNVPKGGDSGAKLNSDFAGGKKSTRSIIDGKDSSK